MQEAEEMEDEKFVKMTEFEFQAEKKVAKDEKRFGNWQSWLEWARRIEGKRRNARNVNPAVKRSELDSLMALREDYISQSSVYFAGPVERDAALYRIDGQIRKLPGGRERVERALEYERQESLPDIHAAILRLHKQVAACQTVKRMIAAARIANFIRQNKKTTSDVQWNSLMSRLENIKIAEKPVEMRWGIPVSSIQKIVVAEDPVEVEQQPKRRRTEVKMTEDVEHVGRRARRSQRDYDANVHIYEGSAGWGNAYK
jgi:hypothetical protein